MDARLTGIPRHCETLPGRRRHVRLARVQGSGRDADVGVGEGRDTADVLDCSIHIPVPGGQTDQGEVVRRSAGQGGRDVTARDEFAHETSRSAIIS